MTLRLSNIVLENWQDVDGYGVGHGFDPLELEFQRLLNFTWWWATRNAASDEVDKFRNRLWRPPPRTEVTHEKSPWHPENENKAFQSLKNALGVKSNSA